MKSPGYYIILLSFLTCQCNQPSVHLAKGLDPDIVLVNIGHGDREYISKIITKIDSLQPLVAGLDVFFFGRRTAKEDSLLIAALNQCKRDILLSKISSGGYAIDHSEAVFVKEASAEGLGDLETEDGLVQSMTPRPVVNGRVMPIFAYKVVELWKPGFHSDIEPDQQVPVNYTRTQSQFIQIQGSDLISAPVDSYDLKNKIFLVGFTGPGPEDMHKTPLRFLARESDSDKPDTYGLVIVANQIRTILEHDNSYHE